MRILHLDGGREMRGGQWQALRLMTALAGAGHEGELLAPAGAPLLERARSAGLQANAVTPWRLWRAAGRAEHVHCHDARSHTWAALCGRRPAVVSRRVIFPIGRGLLSRWKYSRAAHFLAISAAVRSELIAAGISPEGIEVIPDAVPLPAEPSTFEGPIIAPASADPRKGEALLAAAERAGAPPVTRSADLERDLVTARALVYLSESEGLGSAALLAMAYGVPVVASRVGGLPEIVEHEENGLLVENDPQAIASAIHRLAASHDLARRLGAAGRERAAARHSIEAMRDAILAVYREVLR
jgi:hypothetical protein